MGIDSPAKTLEIVLGSAATTREMEWSCSWEDYVNNTNQYGNVPLVMPQTILGDTFGVTNGTKPVSMTNGLAQPDTATDNNGRNITFMSVINRDTATNTVKIQISQSINSIITKNIRFECILLSGFKIIYNIDGGFQVFDPYGSTPTVNYVITTDTDIEIDFLANENISQYDLVTSDGYKADSGNYNTRNKIIGFATTNISSGFNGKALTLGELQNGAWTWAPGDRIFAGPAGSVTNAAPGSTYVQIVGTAIKPDTIDVYIHQAVLL